MADAFDLRVIEKKNKKESYAMQITATESSGYVSNNDGFPSLSFSLDLLLSLSLSFFPSLFAPFSVVHRGSLIHPFSL